MDPSLTVPDAPAGRRGARLGIGLVWLRRNVTSLLMIVAVVCTLSVIVAVVQTSAGRKDELRRAQIALATVPGALAGALQSPIALLGGQPAQLSEFRVSRDLREQLIAGTQELNRVWKTQLARTIRVQAMLVNSRTEDMMGLIAAHRLVVARRLHSTYLQPLAKKITANAASADTQLDGQIRAANTRAWLATLGAVALAGTLLVLALLGLVAARRRRERSESQRERNEIEQTVLIDSERRLKALVEHGSDMITVVAPDTTVLYQAGAVRPMLGYEPDELEGHMLSAWLEPEDRHLLDTLCATKHTAVEMLRLRHRDGTMRSFEARATSLMGHPAWEGIVLNIWDVSERQELEERLRHQAFHDALTGLPNRALFADRVEHALERALRAGETIGVLLIDLDDFKSVNDSLGHAVGDQLLVEVAERLGSTVRGSDTVARLGGDEFAVILEDNASASRAERSAARILAAFSRPVELDDRTFAVAASVGVARSRPGCSATELVRDADVAMYMAKGLGKNRWAVFEPSMHLAIQERLDLKSDLLRAIAALDQFEVYYQPIVTLKTGAIVGLEALVRWNHPTRGLLAPAKFMALAEEIGAIVPIGHAVLRAACHQARRWSDDFDQPLSVSVNVSAQQFDDPQFVGQVKDALAEARLSPDLLVLEITETELMANVEAAARSLQTLKDLGVRIALDDFGTGYSSLSQLEHLPIDIVKVERTFAGTLRNASSESGLIRAVMDIAQTMQLTTVAERIETTEQLHELQDLACPLGQGFLFSRPLPADATYALLATGHGFQGDTGTVVEGPDPLLVIGGAAP